MLGSTEGRRSIAPDTSRDPEIEEEERRARCLRFLVDLACANLMQERMSRSEAEDLVASVRRQALELFPGKEETFDLVLAPRFARLMDEFADRLSRPRVLPFRPR